MDEDDIATYTVKAIDDSRALNSTLYLRPQSSIISQLELVHIYENRTGKTLNKISISAKDFLDSIKGTHICIQHKWLNTVLAF